MRSAARAVPVLLAAIALPLAGQQPTPPPQDPQQPPIFRGRLETVSVPVTVVDPDGTLVTSLTRDDFLIFDNGRRQEITTFSGGLHPITAVVLVDISASMMPDIDLALMAAEQFIIRLRPGDQAKVGLFSARTPLTPEFTGDRDGLLSELREDLPFSNPTRLFDAIDGAVTALDTQPGRRVVVVFTDGCDTASDTTWGRMLDRIYASDVMVYAMLFRPRIVVKPPPSRSLSFGSATWARQGRQQDRPGPCTLHHHLELSPAVRPQDFLRVDDPRWTRGAELVDALSADSGGVAQRIAPADDVNRLFTTLMKELHYLYLLGFTPPALDGKRHELSVRVKDNPSLVVRTRRYYLAPLAPTSRR